MELNRSEEFFFTELINETDIQFRKSPVYLKQNQLKVLWSYSICATPIAKGKGILFGINWGGSGNSAPQKFMPNGDDIIDYHFIKQSRYFLEKYFSLDFSKINFNYSNLCFFRTPKEKDLITEDYLLSLPLFEKYVRFINPPWLLSIGGKSFNVLNNFGLLKNVRPHFDNKNKFKGHTAKLWGYNIYSVPHTSARLTTESRHAIWSKVTKGLNTTIIADD